MSKEIRKTRTANGYAITNGDFYCEDTKQCSVMDEIFVEMIEESEVTAIRVESLSINWFEKNYILLGTFYKVDINVQMTLRSEMRSGKKYWYAYRRAGGKLQKRFVGTSEKVNEIRLRDIGNKMA